MVCFAASCPICFEDFEDTTPSAPPLPQEAGGGKDSNANGEESSALLVNPLLNQGLQQDK